MLRDILGVLTAMAALLLLFIGYDKWQTNKEDQKIRQVRKEGDLEEQKWIFSLYIEDILNYLIVSNLYEEDTFEAELEMLYEDQAPEDRRIWDMTNVEAMVEKVKSRAAAATGEYVGKLEKAFQQLQKQGFVTAHDGGPTRQDASYLCYARKEEREREGETVVGAVYYHQQDLERTFDDKDVGLYLGYDAYAAQGTSKEDYSKELIKRGQEIIQVLEEHGLTTVWDEDPDQRIVIRPFLWDKTATQELISESVYSGV